MMRKLRPVLLSLLGPVSALLISAVLGGLVMLAIGKNPLQVYAVMIQYNLGQLDSIGSIFYRATPLIFSGLAVAIGFKAGLFNIGVEGQYYLGAFLASWAGVYIKGLPVYVHLPLVILFGMAGGVIWAWLPIYLKVKRGAHEVITTIMMNSIASAVMLYLIHDVFMDQNQGALGVPRVRMPPVQPTARMPTMLGFLHMLGIDMPKYVALNWFLALAIVTAVAVYYILWRTPFGYEVRAVGQNPQAAEAAGINTRKIQYQAFLLSGALAGLVGLSDLLTFFGYLDIDFPKGYGFSGIAVALLANNNPFGIILSSLLFGFLERGGLGIQALAGVPREVTTILEGVVILTVVTVTAIIGRRVRAYERHMVAMATAAEPPLDAREPERGQ